MADRLGRDEMFMRIAGIVSERGTCVRKQVGAVMVLNSHVVSTGYNGAPPGMPHCTEVGCDEDTVYKQVLGNGVTFEGESTGCRRAIHAEMNAIAFAARQGARTDDATMYCTCATCANCAALLVSSGIARFVYFEEYRLTAGLDLLIDAGVEVVQWTPVSST